MSPWIGANICAINITASHFRVWQHMGRNHSDMDLQHLATLPSIPVSKIYEHLLNSSQHLTLFTMKLSEDSSLFGVYSATPEYTISAVGSVLPVGVVLFCCYYFWC